MNILVYWSAHTLQVLQEIKFLFLISCSFDFLQKWKLSFEFFRFLWRISLSFVVPSGQHWLENENINMLNILQCLSLNGLLTNNLASKKTQGHFQGHNQSHHEMPRLFSHKNLNTKGSLKFFFQQYISFVILRVKVISAKWNIERVICFICFKFLIIIFLLHQVTRNVASTNVLLKRCCCCNRNNPKFIYCCGYF